MSNEPQLNDELQRLESSLQGISLPASKLNRETLMYQAGWEAAIAQSSESKMNPTKQLNPRSSWIWPAISVVSAAAALLFGVMLILPDDASTAVAEVNSAPAVIATQEQNSFSEQKQSNETPTTNESSTDDSKRDRKLIRLVTELPAGHVLKSGYGLTAFVMRDQEAISESMPENENSAPENLAPPTRQRLLKELLPASVEPKVNRRWRPFG